MDDESGESMELMEEVPLKELDEAALERLVQLALYENVIQGRLARRPFLFSKFLVQKLVQVSCTSFLHVC